MSSIDKLMGDIYENFDYKKEGEEPAVNEQEIDTTAIGVIDNQVKLEDVLEGTEGTRSDTPPIPADDESLESKNESAPVEVHTEELIVSVSKDGQYSLFGLDDFTTGTQQDSGTEDACGTAAPPKTTSGKKDGKKESKPPKPSKPVKPKEEIKVTQEWTIHYSTHTFRISDLFPEMTDTDEKTLEEVRQKMEEEFFEFTQSRVKWDYDKDLKRLYPDVFGTSKGAIK